MSENDRIGHIQNTVDCIEANMYQHLSMEDISGQVYLSRYHLQRIFKSLTGRGIMEYARSRKLTESLYELIHTGDRIVSIAEKYGFEYEQSFTRAFKGEFGLSPSEYRRSPRHVPITPKADPSLLIELDHALLVRPFHVFRPAFELGGLLHQVSIQENLQEFKAIAWLLNFSTGIVQGSCSLSIQTFITGIPFGEKKGASIPTTYPVWKLKKTALCPSI